MATTTTPLYRPATIQWTLPCGPVTGLEYGSGTFTHPYSPTAIPGLPSSCGPSGWYDTSRPSRSTRLIYMSPAICPSGYTVACSWYTTAQGPIPTSDEQAWNCLPTGYACNATRFGTHGANTVTNTVSDWAPMIAIRWASRDLSNLETHPLTPGLLMKDFSTASFSGSSDSGSSESSAPDKSRSTSTPSSSSTALSSHSGSSSLSPGSIAGIVIGAILGVALLAAVIAFLVYKRRRRLDLMNNDIQPPVVSYKPDEKPVHTTVTQVYEIDSSRGSWVPVELPVEHASFNQPPPPAPAQNYYAVSTAPCQDQIKYALSSPSSAMQGVDKNAESPIPVSPATAAASMAATEGDELEKLKNRQSQLMAKRERLIQLDELAEEEERVARRIQELERGGRA